MTPCVCIATRYACRMLRSDSHYWYYQLARSHTPAHGLPNLYIRLYRMSGLPGMLCLLSWLYTAWLLLHVTAFRSSALLESAGAYSTRPLRGTTPALRWLQLRMTVRGLRLSSTPPDGGVWVRVISRLLFNEGLLHTEEGVRQPPRPSRAGMPRSTPCSHHVCS